MSALSDKSPQATAAGPQDASAPQGSPRGWRGIVTGRRGRIVGAVLVVMALGAAIAPWSVSRDVLREEIAGQLRSSSGLFVFTRGRASVSLLPRPHVRFDNLAFVDPNGAMVIETEAMRGDVRILPLLAGRLELSEVTLDRPSITIDVDRHPMTTAGAAVRAADTPRSSPQSARADAARLGILTIIDGSARIRRDGAAFAVLEHIEARLDWRTVASPVNLVARALYRGSPHELSLWIGEPASVLRGEPSPLALQIRGAGSSFTTTGQAVATPRARYEGKVQLSTSSMPELLHSAGVDLGLPAILSAMTIDGDLVATPTGAMLNALKLRAGDDDFEGTLALQATGSGALLSGTLATQSLSMAPYFVDLPALTNADGHVSGETLDLRRASGLDLDLRLSAAHLRYGRLRADDAAMSLLAKAGKFELSIADATAYNGAVKARAVIGPSTAGTFDMQANVQMRGVDWGAVDWELGGQQRIVGIADAALSVEGNGDTFQHVARDLHGQGRLSMTKGDIAGLDLVGTLSRLDKRPLAAATDMGSGHTPFDRGSIALDIKSGVGEVTSGSVVGPGYAMDLGGTVQIADGQLALKAAVRPAVNGATDASAPAFVFEASGPWTRPSFLPDVHGWIRRSDAASPLFGTPAAAVAAPPATDNH
jgi:AsmA protein